MGAGVDVATGDGFAGGAGVFAALRSITIGWRSPPVWQEKERRERRAGASFFVFIALIVTGNDGERSYDSGAAIGLLLDRLDPAWKRRLEEKDDTPLDELLRKAVAGREPMPFPAPEEEAARRRAEGDVKAMRACRGALRQDLLEAPGWTDFRGARASRSGQTVTVTLPNSPALQREPE
jgi:hypothetical protein